MSAEEMELQEVGILENYDTITDMLFVTCSCGLQRALPKGIQVGDNFRLVACPRCGSGLVGTLVGDKVEVK